MRPWACAVAVVTLAACAEQPTADPPTPLRTDARAAPLTDAAPLDADPPDAAPPPPCDWTDVVALPTLLLDEDGRSPVKTFEVPADVESLTVVVLGRAGDLYVVERLTDGRGEALVSATPHGTVINRRDAEALVFPGPFLSPNRVTWGDGVATAMVPNNPQVALAPGPWSLQVASVDALGWPARSIVDAWVLMRRVERACPAHHQDLHLHFTGAAGWWAGTAGRDPRYRDLLRTVTALYRDVGVTVRVASAQDIDARYRIVNGAEGLARLLGRGHADTGVDVFLVGRLQDPTGAPLAGVAGALPGPALMPGTRASGVAVAIDLLADDDGLGVAVAHEVGHFLGLFHPSERDDRYPDQLPDTPLGEAATRNVMYRTTGDPRRRFSPMQGEVLRRSLAVVRAPGD
ncbi:MAG: hypothetical protein KC583_14385 [Myxococcales bacterium]|nr:hypothetical protein [Myxococcales bacterium]